jgi:hypothetical protein
LGAKNTQPPTGSDKPNREWTRIDANEKRREALKTLGALPRLRGRGEQGGSIVGLLLGVAGSQILSAIVYQASAQDPFVLGAVAVTILLTGGLSVTGPVRKALNADPALLLREQ